MFMGAVFSIEGAHGGVALITVFNSAEIAAVAGGVLKECAQVGDANDLDGAADAGVVLRGDAEGHEEKVAQHLRGPRV
jgi:hypothetical protein